MTRVLLVGFICLLLIGCAISGAGNWPHPVWIWECWWGGEIC